MRLVKTGIVAVFRPRLAGRSVAARFSDFHEHWRRFRDTDPFCLLVKFESSCAGAGPNQFLRVQMTKEP